MMGAQQGAWVASAWDESAQGWHRNAALIRTWLRDATAEMLAAAQIAPGARVLDVAAGAGDQTLDIAQRVGALGTVLATDISPGILALAQDTVRAAGFSQVQTRVADAQALGLAGADFDAAVFRLGLMFCPSPLRALKEIRQALRPQGGLSALVFSHPAANPCLAILARTAQRHAGLPAGDPFAPGSLMSLGKPGLLAQWLREAGFTDIEVRPVSAPFSLPSAQDYIAFVRTSASPIIEMLKALPASAQQDAWDDMTCQLEAFSTARGWEGPNELLLCSAATTPAARRSASARRPGRRPPSRPAGSAPRAAAPRSPTASPTPARRRTPRPGSYGSHGW